MDKSDPGKWHGATSCLVITGLFGVPLVLFIYVITDYNPGTCTFSVSEDESYSGAELC